MKATTYEETTAILRAIAHAPDPTMRVLGMRRKSRKEWAQAVRSLLKEVGIKGVSVTAPNYSMASSIDIILPRYDYERHQCYITKNDPTIEYRTAVAMCKQCQRKQAASKRLNEIILLAFPDLNDRSEYQSDYFDFCFTIE